MTAFVDTRPTVHTGNVRTIAMGKGKKRQQLPLAEELDEASKEKRILESKRKRMIRRRAEGQGDDGEELLSHHKMASDRAAGEKSSTFLDPKLSQKILKVASRQAAEEERNFVLAQDDQVHTGEGSAHVHSVAQSSRGKTSVQKQEDSSESDEEDMKEVGGNLLSWDEEGSMEYEEDGDGTVEVRDGAVYSVDRGGLSEIEHRVVSSFMDVGAGERRTLADIILDKIHAKAEDGAASGLQGQAADGDEPLVTTISPKVQEVYSEIGRLLKTYTAGKLPKAFKILPALSNWEEVMYLTRPDEWTPHATYAATRIFASNLNAKLSQRFFNLVLLEKCRDDILSNKNLNYHYYMALKKAMYKPGAFFKGILLPLIQSGDCTVREATIVGSVLGKVSIPVSHAAVVLLKLATARDYSASCSIFLKALLNKKYTLPYRVIDSLVEYFVSFAEYEGHSLTASTGAPIQGADPVLPVLWHQSLLLFAQRYKEEITREDKERLREVMKAHQHHQITPEIRRELFNCRCRGEKDESDALLKSMLLE
ncbi:Bystin [Nannochloropsis gaditana]|uniref:Bystin n=1 Tax=Nannochloropsis gaditana TaxID=72520 RepID=W7TMG5_9STRA|nr:Bystin [Nannochloropsis gaditana]